MAKGNRSPSRLAALDVGTNTIRCIVAEADNGSFRTLDDEKATVRLGEGLLETGAISPGAWERAGDAMARMRKILDGLGVTAVTAVATSAVRKASNGKDFIRAMKKRSGISIEAISTETEAELAALSARNNFNLAGQRYAVADIGGGSIEIVLASGEHNEEIHSLELGAVVLTEQFLRRDPIPKKDFVILRRHVRRELKRTFARPAAPLQYLVGSGGTMTTIGWMVMNLRGESYDSVHGYEVLHSDIVHLLAMLRHLSCSERTALAGLSPDRADIIVAGVTVVDRLMRRCDLNVLKVNDRGIREGLILKALRDRGLAGPDPDGRDWRSAAESFARSCHVDERHSRQVSRIALKIHDALERRFDLGERSRKILEAAALLHDTGYRISYPKHHKHSYHLIRHANLYDFTPREKEIIANVARYHRRALPKRKHEGFASLAPADRETVRKLGGVLRLADGLDRRRIQTIRDLRCYFRGKTFTVRLEGQRDLSVEIHGGLVKGDLFEKVFGLTLRLKEESVPRREGP